MYEDLDGGTAVFDFDELADLLLEQGLQNSPSELHGCLSGLLAAGASHQPEAGLDALAQALDLVPHGELAEQAMRLYTVTSAAMLDEEFHFYPLLPDDDTDIAERTEAMAQWCRGFLAGFAHATARANRGDAPLAGDSSEILKDMAAIATAGVDEEAEEEESEASYAELVEYLRFGTLNIFMDNAPRAQDDDVPKPPLH